MSGLFKRPKPAAAPEPIDPSALGNRVADQRLSRLGMGGAGSTILTQRMNQVGGAAQRATLTGMSG